MPENVFQRISPHTDIGAAIHALAGNLGAPYQAFLALTGVTADAQTFTVGARVHQLMLMTAVIGAGATCTTGAYNNLTNPLLDVPVVAAHVLTVGMLVLIGSEILEVIRIDSTANASFARGKYGTTIAVHVDTTAITKQTSALVSGRYAVPTQTTAAAQAVIDIVRGFNSHVGPNHSARITAVDGGATTTIAFYSDSSFATAETMTNGAWTHGAAAAAGAEKGATKMAAVTRTMVASETTPKFVFGFPVKNVIVAVRIAAGTVKLYDGGITITGNVVSLDAGGATDLIATDVVSVVAVG